MDAETAGLLGMTGLAGAAAMAFGFLEWRHARTGAIDDGPEPLALAVSRIGAAGLVVLGLRPALAQWLPTVLSREAVVDRDQAYRLLFHQWPGAVIAIDLLVVVVLLALCWRRAHRVPCTFGMAWPTWQMPTTAGSGLQPGSGNASVPQTVLTSCSTWWPSAQRRIAGLGGVVFGMVVVAALVLVAGDQVATYRLLSGDWHGTPHLPLPPVYAGGWPVFLWSLVLMAPLVEEWLDRVLLFPVLVRFLGIPGGIVASGFLFAASHGAQTWPEWALRMVVGGLCALGYQQTRSALTPVAFHMTGNAVAAALLWLG